jgi:CDP-glucose 4,6-dehydratase
VADVEIVADGGARYASREWNQEQPMREPFNGFYRGKTVLVTGHTGFKGSWLALWLTKLGARVVGYALDPPSDPSNFVACRLSDAVVDLRGDVRDGHLVARALRDHAPDVVFHLSAQSLVRRSFDHPADTFGVNLMGTVNVLDAAVRTGSVQAAVIITSDKCYRNQEWPWGYRETDVLGGSDPYSASKGCAELAVASYQDPVLQRRLGRDGPLPIASVRAGNVIGGGDWAVDRLIPDIARAVSRESDITIRQPGATRPWQHVLEPLSGYLWLGSLLAKHGLQYAEAWNFGPNGADPVTVGALAARVLERWAPPRTRLILEPENNGTESVLLHLDCSKVQHRLGWRLAWTVDDTVHAIVSWYRAYLAEPAADMTPYALDQIAQYTARAAEQDLSWSRATASSAA